MGREPIIRSVADAIEQDVEHATGASIQVLLGPDDGMPNLYLRRFTIQPGGRIPFHSHPDIEHEQLVLEGEMVLTLGDEETSVGPGAVVYIPAGVAHAYENRSQGPVRFLCAVPATASYSTDWLE